MKEIVFLDTRRTSFMQALQQAASNGYVYFVSGTVPRNKIDQLAIKFVERYDITGDANIRTRRKRAGRANARLFCYSINEMEVYFVLMRTEPDTIERWRDVREKQQRLELAIYAMVRVNGKWTWHIQKGALTSLMNTSKNFIRNRQSVKLNDQIIEYMRRAPGHAGVRKQVFALWRFIEAECKRSSMPNIELPKHGYARKVKHKGIWLI